jgi:tetratricopeptide (TPR) repeat protein
VKLPYRLMPTTEPGPVTGLLLLGDDVADLLRLAAAVGSQPFPALFAVPNGFLMKLAEPETRRFPGVLRLRRLAANLFVPADAVLLPALFDDEAEGLTRDRGLVFLPGGQVLAYDPEAELPLAGLLRVRRVPPRTWRPLPPRPDRPDRLREVRLDLPETLEEVVSSGGTDIGVDVPRPASAGPLTTAAGQTQAGLGRLLVWLGKLLSWRSLAQQGAELVRGAVERVPRLSEELLGRQEAALRELLRQFQQGDLDAALRRALPLGGSDARGSTSAADANLPTHNLRFSLRELLSLGQRPASLWSGGGAVQTQLAAEYRKAAEAALARGDYRRAAFIYYRLLADYRSAATALARGGHHRDAARIFLERLNDPLSAARAFADAGDVDRAVELYQRHGKHLEAGDLLRQVGQHDEAFVEYRLAAGHLSRTGNHLGAGDLLRDRAERPDLAVIYYRFGWAERPQSGALACVQRLLEGESDVQAFRSLAEEAGSWFGRSETSDADAGQFFNALARLANRPFLAALRDDLRDQALLGLAGRLRSGAARRTAPAPILAALLGHQGAWPVPVVHDAETAYRSAYQSAAPVTVPTPLVPDHVRLGVGVITAACQAPETEMVFVGFRDGAIARFDPRTGNVVRQPGVGKPVKQLATDAMGTTVVAQLGEGPDNRLLLAFEVGLDFSDRRAAPLDNALSCRLTPIRDNGTFGIYYDESRSIQLFLTSDLMPRSGSFHIADHDDGPALGAVLLSVQFSAARISALTIHAGMMYHRAHDESTQYDLGWCIAPANHVVCNDSLRVRPRPHFGVELVRCGFNGHCYWKRLSLNMDPVIKAGASEPVDRLMDKAISKRSCYLAATMLQFGQVAAVHADGIDWLHPSLGELKSGGTTAVNLTRTVACFHSPLTGEVLTIHGNGILKRVAQPR